MKPARSRSENPKREYLNIKLSPNSPELYPVPLFIPQQQEFGIKAAMRSFNNRRTDHGPYFNYSQCQVVVFIYHSWNSCSSIDYISCIHLFITGTNYVYLFSDNHNELFINQLGTLCQAHLSCSERLYFRRTNCSATPSV